MAAIAGKYDTNASPSGVMEEHECTAQITASDCKATSRGDGEYIATTWTILDGPHKGRTLFANYNIRNPNAMAQQIGNAEFAAVRKALFGTKDKVVNDTNELHDLPCKIKVGCRKRKDNDEMENHIKKYTSLRDVVVTNSAASTAGKPF